jgi:hypothetical protein
LNASHWTQKITIQETNMDTACYKCTQYITNRFDNSGLAASFTHVEWLHFQNYVFAVVLLFQEIVDGNIALTDDKHLDDNGVIYEMPQILNGLTGAYGFWKDKEAAVAASKLFLDDTLQTLITEAVGEIWLSQDSDEFEEFQLSCEKIISNCKTPELQFYDIVLDTGSLTGEWLQRAEALFRPINVIYVPPGRTAAALEDVAQSQTQTQTADSHSTKKRSKFPKTRRVTVDKKEAIPLKRSKYPPNTRRKINRI